MRAPNERPANGDLSVELHEADRRVEVAWQLVVDMFESARSNPDWAVQNRELEGRVRAACGSPLIGRAANSADVRLPRA
jgi:hypothetical protein